MIMARKRLGSAADFATLLGFGFSLYAAVRSASKFVAFRIVASSKAPHYEDQDSTEDREKYVGRIPRATV